jgi:NAD-dependent SIR2 family protein deacetylase
MSQHSYFTLRWRCEKCGHLISRELASRGAAINRPEICRECGNTDTGFKVAVVKITVTEKFWQEVVKEEFVRLVQ